MTKPTAPLPCSEFELEYPHPRHRIPVEALNGITPWHMQWRSYGARKTMLDYFGHPINLGDKYYRRDVGTERTEYENLSLPSMARLLWLVFGLNPNLVKTGQDIDAKRFEEMREGMERAARMFGADTA